MIQIPSLVENNISNFLSGVSGVQYPVVPSFTVADYELPTVLVKAGKFRQIEPATHVFEGMVAVSVITQIDDVENTLETHDEVTSTVYDAMNGTGLAPYFNNSGHLWNIYLDGIDQDRADRHLITILEYSVTAQNLTLD